MSSRVIVFRRCGCVDASTGRQLGRRCNRLVDSDHGSWYYAVQVPTVNGRRARHRRGGYRTSGDAHAAGRAVVDRPQADVAAQAWTAGRWLEYWLRTVDLRPSTVNSYRQHVRRYLVPLLGRLRLDELTVPRVQACFDHLAQRRTRAGQRISPATVDRVRATLRSALNAAVSEGILANSPMRAVKVARPARPHPMVWTEERVAQWKHSGVRPPVAVWTLPQLVRFLDGVKDDRLAGVWWLIALRGLRRGEATGLRRGDLDSQARELAVHRQVVALPGVLYYGPPKSRAGNRTVALDGECVTRLQQQLTRQATDVREHRYITQARSNARTHLGMARDTDDRDPLFTYADGRPIRPEYLSHRFRTLVKQLGLPPIRLHDLRHGVATVATVALAAHADLKVIQHMLGHASIVTTADTYTSVLPEVAHSAAQASADLIMQVARLVPRPRRQQTGVPHKAVTVDESGYRQA